MDTSVKKTEEKTQKMLKNSEEVEEEEEVEEKEKKMKKMGKEGKKSEKNDKNPQVFFCSDGRLWSSSWSQWNEFKSSLYKQTNNTVHKKKRKKSNTHKKKQTLTGLFLSLPGFTEFCAAPRGLELGWVHSKTRLPSFTGFRPSFEDVTKVVFELTNQQSTWCFPSLFTGFYRVLRGSKRTRTRLGP